MSVDDRLIRWHAVVHYRTENGVLDDEHDLEELGELHDLIERGPQWYYDRADRGVARQPLCGN